MDFICCPFLADLLSQVFKKEITLFFELVLIPIYRQNFQGFSNGPFLMVIAITIASDTKLSGSIEKRILKKEL